MLRRHLSACATCAPCVLVTLALFGSPARAAPPTEPPADPAESDAQLRVEQGIEAWRKGEWTEVRDLLEPLVRDQDIEDEFLRESALRYLAEATLLDEGLDPSEREEQTKQYIARLLDGSADWAPPSGLHSRTFYDLVARVRSERDAQLAETCRGELLSCEADLNELQVDYRTAQDKIAALQEDLASEDVFLTEVVKRNRGLALLPLGVGHFTNGNYAIGGGFLALEVAAGATGLGLLLYRTINFGCVRTDGFNRKSLVCTSAVPDEDIPKRQDDIEAMRNAEAVMGYVFIGALVLDIAVAQILFTPIEIVEKGKKTRRELDEELEQAEPAGGPRPGRRQPGGGPDKADEPSVRLRVRPHPAMLPAGVGFGVTLQF